MNELLRLLAVLAALAALATLAPAAQAAFPGRNGAVGFVFLRSSGEGEPQSTRAGLAARRLSMSERRELVTCELTEGQPTEGDCTARSFGSPSYSPDGRRIVFDAGERLAVINADGTGLALLPAVTSDDGDPAFAPDGRRIVFTGANDRGTTDIWRMRLDGMFARSIVSDASMPAWSSRNEIAYVRSGNVYVTGRDGNRRRFVTSGVSPDWSPNGGRLALIRPLPRLTFDVPIGRIFVVGARGRGLRRFGRDDDAQTPVWSPDGRWLAYYSSFSGVYAKRFGSRAEPVEIATSQYSGESGSVESYDPTWRPLRR